VIPGESKRSTPGRRSACIPSTNLLYSHSGYHMAVTIKVGQEARVRKGLRITPDLVGPGKDIPSACARVKKVLFVWAEKTAWKVMMLIYSGSRQIP